MTLSVSTQHEPVVEPEQPAAQTGLSRVRRVAGSGWIPALVVYAAIVWALHYFDVAVPTTFTFTAYVVVVLTLPGALIWRTVHRDRPRLFVEDVAAGTVIGYAIEILSYIPARAAGVPLAFLAAPLGVVVAFVAVPGLRQHWRRTARPQRAPAWWSWLTAGLVTAALAWSYALVSVRGLLWPRWALVDMDSPFHLALTGELKHHIPPRVPYLIIEPLHYHWFVYCDMAAASWATGIEPEILLYRLSMLPMIVGLLVLIALAGRRLTQRWWPGLIAVVIAQFAVSPNAYGWRPDPRLYGNGAGIVEDASLMRQAIWTSPTQDFGAVVFVPLVMVVIDLLRGSRSRGRWVLLGLLMLASTGTKATFLPVLGAGLAFAFVGELLFRRRWNWTTFAIGAVTGACIGLAQLLLYSGTSAGLHWSPGTTPKYTTIAVASHLFRTSDTTWPWIELAGLLLLCWALLWSGVAGLAARRVIVKPEYLTLLGMGVAGLAILVLMNQDGGSHGFFLMSARPYLALAAAAGISACVPVDRDNRRTHGLLAASGVVGIGLILAVRALDTQTVPTKGSSGGQRGLLIHLALPYVGLLALVGTFAAALCLARRRLPGLRGISLAMVLAATSATTVPAILDQLRANVVTARDRGWLWGQTDAPTAPEGTRVAGRWLRDHSSPDDIVATNAHCRPTFADRCDARLFWFAAYSERHFLVESWGYTAEGHDVADKVGVLGGVVPFWNMPLLAANDAVFDSPSPAAIAVLRDKYHVRWLMTDDRAHPSPQLGRYATLVFHATGCSIYRLP